MYTQQNTERKFGKDRCHQFEKEGFGKKFRGHFIQGNHPLKEIFAKKASSFKPVNIIEDDHHFILKLYAAGLNKQLFKITVKDQVLTVFYNAGDPENKEGKVIYQEFYESSFERRFQLTDKVFDDQVAAAYENGILTVTLPKNPEKNKPAQEVSIN